MSVVNITNIQVLNNPAKFDSPFAFDITFECISALKEDLEWKIVYVGSAESEQYDQVLDCIMVGPVPVGVNRFVFQADPPNPSLIPQEEILGVTIVLLICSYNSQEFVRVGYYVNVDYEDEALKLEPPEIVVLDKIQRNILAEKPRVTRFPVKWDNIEMPKEEIDNEEEEESQVEQGNDSFVKDNLMELAYS